MHCNQLIGPLLPHFDNKVIASDLIYRKNSIRDFDIQIICLSIAHVKKRVGWLSHVFVDSRQIDLPKTMNWFNVICSFLFFIFNK